MHRLEADRIDELIRRLHASGYDEIKAPPSEYPGENPLTLGELRVGEEWPTLRHLPLDQPQLEEVMQLIFELQSEIRKHPVRVIRGQARWRDVELRENEDAEVEVVLENVGIQSLQISQPMDPRQTQAALHLSFFRVRLLVGSTVSSSLRIGSETPYPE